MNVNYVFLAPGFEEIEAITPIDVLRRAGLDVKSVSVADSLEVAGAHGVVIKADMMFADADVNNANWLILPGGLPGASNLLEFKPLADSLKAHAAKKGNLAAICAAPGLVLGSLGILSGKRFSTYPSFEKYAPDAIYEDKRVVVEDNIVTGNGPSSALQFALAIVASEMGENLATEVASGMLAK